MSLRDLADRRADLVLAVVVVGIVAMMIVPLPTFLIDLGIALNLLLDRWVPDEELVLTKDTRMPASGFGAPRQERI